jgi:alanine racemase
LILSYTTPYRYPDLVDFQITATLFDLEQAKELSRVAVERGQKAKVHLAVDTGMGRIGLEPTASGADIAKEIASLPGLFVEGLFSHYACADCEDKEDANRQTALFDAFLSLLEERGVQIPLKHICNSAGSMEMPRQYDMCRFGIAMYGMYPSDEVDTSKVLLEPAMEVISHVIHIKTVPTGFQIGYGHTYTAPSPRRIATVSIGYADGFNRCLSEGGYVLIGGEKAPLVGRVCMDQIMVDISDCKNEICVGDPVVVIGESKGVRLSAEEFGQMGHSFHYEAVCTFLPRVHRIYYENS